MLCPDCGADAGESSKYCPSCGASIVRAAEADDYIGKTIIRKYRVEALIGEGGMGKVYRARQIALDKPVVLKVLRQTLLSDERTVARFQREAKAASRLNHPNSISILDFGQAEDGSLFIAMEFVAGKDLHAILSREWPLPESRVVRIVSQVLSALSDAHSAGVIHRDLKPENIMVEQRRGEPDFVKVLDFGIAKIQDASGDDGKALTRAGFVCGTPEYMSPEQARGGMLDHRSDLYAVGVILYQLATGLLPFESDSAVGFATKHLTEQPPSPSQRRPDARISAALERLILRALAKDPNDRPQTADAFREELLAVEREVPARPARPAPPSGVARRTGPLAAPVLGPLPRRMTPDDGEMTTRLSPGPGWGAQDSTVRHVPEAVRARVEEATRTTRSPEPAPRARPEPVRPAPERSAPAALHTETDPQLPAGGGGLFAVKVLTGGLVAVALLLLGYYVWSSRTPAPVAYVPPQNAPIPGGSEAGPAPLYARDIPAAERDATESARLAREGDRAHQNGNLSLAATRYQEAFSRDPTPELSLKLGQVHWQRNEVAEARGWWQRHLRDHGASKARGYILEQFPDLLSQAQAVP